MRMIKELQIFLITLQNCGIFMLSSIFWLYVKHNKTTLNAPSTKFSISLLVAHILNITVLMIIALTDYIIHFSSANEYHFVADTNIKGPKFWFQEIAVSLQLTVTLNIAILSIDRYFALKLHLQYYAWFGSDKQIISLVAVWGISSLALPLHLTSNSIIHTVTIVTIIIFTIVLLLVTNCYLYCNVRKHLRKIRTDSLECQTTQAQHTAGERKAFNITFIIIINYVVMFLPIAIIETLQQSVVTIPIEIHITIAFLVTVHGITDAAIYTCSKRRMKREFIKKFKNMTFLSKCIPSRNNASTVVSET